MNRSISKKDLKTGMIVTNRLGYEFVVFLCELYIKNRKYENVLIGTDKKQNRCWSDLTYYSDDLRNLTDSNFDIVKIEMPVSIFSIQDLSHHKKDRKLMWSEEQDSLKSKIDNETDKYICKTGNNVRYIVMSSKTLNRLIDEIKDELIFDYPITDSDMANSCKTVDYNGCRIAVNEKIPFGEFDIV